MVKICPVSTQMTNEKVSRMNALFTVLLVVACLISGSILYAMLLFIDFLLRNVNQGRLSPIIRMNKYMVGALSLEPRMINAGPKVFAARVGFVLSFLVMVLSITATHAAAMVPAGVLGLFSFLEMAFGYCVACKLYPFILPLNEKINRFIH